MSLPQGSAFQISAQREWTDDRHGNIQMND